MMKTILVAKDIVWKIVVFKPYQSFSFSFNSKGSRPNHSNELVRYNIYGFSQKKPSFYSSKLDFLSSQLKRLRDQHQEIQAKINQAIVQKENIDKQLDSENLMMSKLKRYLNDNLNPSPQNMQQLRQKQQAIDSLKMKIAKVEKTVKELKNEQEQLKKQERELTKNNDPQEYKWQLWFGFGALLVGLVGLYKTVYFGNKGTYYSQRQDKQTQIGKEDQAQIRYRTNNFDNDLRLYVQGSPIQNQLYEFFNNPKKNRLLFIAGCPGVGKSTSIKHLIKKHREWQSKNSEVDKDKKGIKDVYYYIDLNMQEADPKQKVQNLKYLLRGIKQKYQNTKGIDWKSIKLIIDDINHLEALDQYELANIIQLISTYFTAEYLHIICISSSSGFIQKLSRNPKFSTIKKRSTFNILQDLSGQKYQIFQRNLLTKYYPKITESIMTLIIKNKESLRDVIAYGENFQKLQTEKSQLSFLEENETKILKHLEGIFLQIFKQEKNTQSVRMLIEKIINSSETLQISKCNDIQSQITATLSGKSQYIGDIVNKFDQWNMIIFCRPRSQIYRNAFKNALNLLRNRAEARKQEKNEQ